MGRGQLSDPTGRHQSPVLRFAKPIESNGEHDFTCPGCDEILLRRVSAQAVHGITFRCPSCGAYSRVPSSSPEPSE